jgi:hypothetical protein
MSISVTIKGLDYVVVELGKFGPELARRVVLDMSQIAFTKMQEGASLHSKKGNLLASVFNRAIPNGREVGHDGQRAPHAEFVLFGTRPHIIRPKDKKALRWVSGNGFVFARVVNHPGYLGDNYLETAATDAIKAMPGIVDQAIKGQ